MKSSNYLKYAFGEFFLVVAGILVALQINTWSENIKNRKYELTMLREVKEALDQDIRVTKRLISSLEQIQRDISLLAEMNVNPSHPRDSLEFFIKELLDYGVVFTVNSGPYEAIKSSGLDRISNTEIRHALSSLFGFDIPRAEDWINNVHRKKLYERDELLTDLFEQQLFLTNQNGVSVDVSIPNPLQVLNDPRYIKLIYTAGWPLPPTLRQISIVSERMKTLSGLIDQEIKDN